jgi:hypothetical protein
MLLKLANPSAAALVSFVPAILTFGPRCSYFSAIVDVHITVDGH